MKHTAFLTGTVFCLLALLFAAQIAQSEEMKRITSSLDHSNWETRLAAVDSLASIKTEKAFEMLMYVADMNAEYWPVKIRAMQYLGERRDPRAIDLLLKVYNDTFLNNECPSIKSYAATALGYFTENRVVAALIEGVDDPEVLTREAVIQSLGRIGNPKATPALILALKDKSYAVRKTAIQALASIKDPKAIHPLQEIVKHDKDAVMREEAADAIRKIKS